MVLMLHGGQAHGLEPTSRWQSSVLRLVPFTAAIARRRRGNTAIAVLRYAVRGWNAHGDPVRDARWALAEMERVCGDLPVALVGYSMGGRAALRLVNERPFAALVTLSAWAEPAEMKPAKGASSMKVLMLHGGADQVCPPAGTEAAARVLRQARVGVDVEIVPGDTHSIFANPRYWHQRTAAFVNAALPMPPLLTPRWRRRFKQP